MLMLPGCIVLAVQTARAVDRKLDPPEKPLMGVAEFFGNELTATARLIPLDGHRRGTGMMPR